MLLLDLILLKRDVYRHLLFNRGLGARKVGQVGISSTIVTSNGCEQETGTWGTMPQTGNDNGPPNRSMEQVRENNRYSVQMYVDRMIVRIG